MSGQSEQEENKSKKANMSKWELRLERPAEWTISKMSEISRIPTFSDR